MTFTRSSSFCAHANDVVIFVRAAAVFATTAFIGCSAAHANPSSEPSPAPAVQTFTAGIGSVQPRLAISGILAPFRDVGVSAALNEPILEIRVREGQRVRRGDLLAVLASDSVDASLAAARQTATENRARAAQQGFQSTVNVAQYASNVAVASAALDQTKAVVAQARIDLQRYEALNRQGYLPDQTLEGQRVSVAADQRAVAAAQAQLDLSEQTAKAGGTLHRDGMESAQIAAAHAAVGAADQAVAQAQLLLERTQLRSPVDGVIASISGAIGEYPSGRQLFTIHDDTQMYAMFAASPTQAVRLHGGEQASITDGTAHATGVVEAVLDQLSPGTTNFIVKVRLPNADHRWRAGLPVTSIIALMPVTGTRVPVSAYADVTNNAIFVVNAGKIVRRDVQTLASDGSAAIVQGIDRGARVVRDGQSGVVDGDVVKN